MGKFLVGSSQVAVVVCVSPDREKRWQTLQSLDFAVEATRARVITGGMPEEDMKPLAAAIQAKMGDYETPIPEYRETLATNLKPPEAETVSYPPIRQHPSSPPLCWLHNCLWRWR